MSIGLRLIDDLSVGIGPRPPCSEEEREAGRLIGESLAELGLEAETEEFPSKRSFGSTYLAVFGLALLAAAIERRSRALGSLAGISAAALAVIEARFSLRTPLGVQRNRTSQNVSAVIEPAGKVEQTVCLVSHMDSSRSGLMFHPRVTPHLSRLVTGVSLAVVVQALSPLIRQYRWGRLAVWKSRALIAAGFGLVLEREVRGVDVPGANDNASGAGACLCLAAHFSARPLESTRLVILVTGSEESGVFGMREFLSRNDTGGWRFVNFDGVSADAPLRVLSREGGPLGRHLPDPGLLEAAKSVGELYPELKAEPLLDGSGLPYDATPVIFGGGKAITIVNQEGAIPDYHWPTDTADHVSVPAFTRAVRFAAQFVRNLDRLD